MKQRRCIAFKQSQDYPELFMPCTNPVDRSWNGHGQDGSAFLCREHALARQEILLGVFNEARAFAEAK